MYFRANFITFVYPAQLKNSMKKSSSNMQLEGLYHKMVQEVQDYAILLIDIDGTIENWNLGAEKIKGYTADEIIGSNFRVFYTAEAQKNLEPEKLLQQASDTGRVSDEGWRVKKDGTLFWASVVITALHDENNGVIGFSKVTKDLTEKRNVDLELKLQAELFDIIPDGIIYGKRDLTIVKLNRAAEYLFETPSFAAVGRKMYDIVTNDMNEEVRQEARKMLWEGKGIWTGEANFTTPHGKKTCVLITLKALTSTNNTGADWVGIYTDISRLKTTQQRLETALDGMVAGVWDWNPNELTGWWSPRYLELLGYEQGEIKPEAGTLQSLLHPDDAPIIFEAIRQHFLVPESFERRARYKLKNGTYRWFSVTGKTKFDASGKALNMTGTIIDIHDKKIAEELIEDQSALIQMAPDGIVYGSLDNKIISLNESAEKLLEVSNEEARGHNIDDFLQVKIIGTNREQVRNDLADKGYSRHEAELTNLKGKKYIVLTSVKTVNNIPGHGPGWIAIYNDISPLKLNDELKAANDYLEQLAFISAHDIKSPIHTLSSLTYFLLKSEKLDDKDREMLVMQHNVIEQMQRTNLALNDILKLRKGLLSKNTMHTQTLPLPVIVNNVVHALHNDIERAGASINIKLQHVAHITFPFYYLQSVFHNLITNALKFSDVARPLVITIDGKETADNTFWFTVADNGLGFDVERTRPKLFGIFKRFHPGTEGTGVGLHITKSIVDAYGGHITVTSAPGAGTTFKITFKKTL